MSVDRTLFLKSCWHGNHKMIVAFEKKMGVIWKMFHTRRTINFPYRRKQAPKKSLNISTCYK